MTSLSPHRGGVRVARSSCAVGGVLEVPARRRRSLVGSLPCRTRPAARPGRVGHHAHRHSPARVTAAASFHRTSARWSPWCICANTTPSRRSPPASASRWAPPTPTPAPWPTCSPRGHPPAQSPARSRPGLRPARRHPRRMRPPGRWPERLLHQAPTPRGERPGRDRPSRPGSVVFTRPAGTEPRLDRGPHPPDHPDLRTAGRPVPRRPRLPWSRPPGDDTGQTPTRS